MELIDKSALVAEIERRISDNKKDMERASHKFLEDYFEGYEDALTLLKQQFLDTLKVKEVDLEKEATEFVQTKEFVKNENPVLAIAKHFFELGLKAQSNGMIEALRTEYEKGRADAIAEMQKEWSEEDEVKINRIVACLENLNVADNDILLKDVDWLKSLKERYAWKPSDEQIRALEYIINNAHNTSYSCKIAKELLEQLKKLKGE